MPKNTAIQDLYNDIIQNNEIVIDDTGTEEETEKQWTKESAEAFDRYCLSRNKKTLISFEQKAEVWDDLVTIRFPHETDEENFKELDIAFKTFVQFPYNERTFKRYQNQVEQHMAQELFENMPEEMLESLKERLSSSEE